LLSGSLLAWVTLYKKNGFANVKHKLDYWLSRIIFSEKQEADGKTLSNVLSFVGLLLLVYGFWRINKELSFPGKWALVPVLGTVLIITAGSKAWVNRTILSNKVAVWFGLISYPLYLWHWPILSFARIIESEVPSRNIRIAAVALSFVLACLTYKLVERPLRFGNYSKVKVTVLVVLMTIVGYAGYYSYKKDGLEFRYPQIVSELSSFKYDHKVVYRHEICFLIPKQIFSDYAEECFQNNFEKNKTILIWGDSHAAHLYAGFKKNYASTHNIIQLTGASCPSILNTVGTMSADLVDSCKVRNELIFKYIKDNSIDKIVLSNDWTAYDLSKLGNTILSLKNIGIKNIYIVGPVPDWNDGLPRQLIKYFYKNTFHNIPNRMNFGLNDKFINMDDYLSKISSDFVVNYISPYKILCDNDGCITKLGNSSNSLIQWDSRHLTQTGSDFLVSFFPTF
jgi:hypothetical protein